MSETQLAAALIGALITEQAAQQEIVTAGLADDVQLAIATQLAEALARITDGFSARVLKVTGLGLMTGSPSDIPPTVQPGQNGDHRPPQP